MPRILVAFALAVAASAAAAEPPAKELFGAVQTPALMPPASIGAPAKGCLAGAEMLPVDGQHWQVMRLSRRRNFGHPRLLAYLERFSEAAAKDGWPGVLVGDMSQPRGGPMRTGHASHQSGIDVDLWLTPAPDHTMSSEERETVSAISVLKPGTRELEPAIWNEARARFIHDAANDPEVARVFVHPAIKKALCGEAGKLGASRAWLGRVRPWWGHDDHIHVRLKCPADSPACQEQDPPPAGDGCGSELAYWLSDEPWKKPSKPAKPKPPLRLADLPQACRAVLAAPDMEAPQAGALPR